mgnify:CR=1 FL=1
MSDANGRCGNKADLFAPALGVSGRDGVLLPDGPQIDPLRVELSAPDDFDGWRNAARDLIEAGVPPTGVVWEVAGADADLFGGDAPPPSTGASFAVPRAFVDLAKKAICHSDPERFALLYTLLHRMQAQRALIDDHADPLVRRIEELIRCPVALVSTSPERDDTILVRDPFAG